MAEVDTKDQSSPIKEQEPPSKVTESTSNGDSAESVKEVQKQEENDAADSEPTDLEKKIIRQFEYYFGDSNLPRDNFLQEEIKKDNGWISFDTMKKFKRLAAMSEDVKVWITALNKSQENLLEVSPDCTKVRRNPERPLVPESEEVTEAKLKRSLYAKGFPIDATLDDLEAYFDKHGKVENIHMRRFRPDPKKPEASNFKGSVFVQFSAPEEAQAFLAAEEMKYKDTDLIRKTKAAYLKEKEEEVQAMKQKVKEEKERRQKNRLKQDEQLIDKIKSKMTKNAVLFMKNIPQNTEFELLKELWGKHGDVAFVDFDDEDKTKAFVRFHKEGTAEKALEAMKQENDGKVKFIETELDVNLVEGDEEIAYWKRRFGSSLTSRKRQGGRGGHSGLQNKRKKFSD